VKRKKGVIYPVTHTLPSGRRQVAVTSNGLPAPDVEHSTGWICHPDDLPNHRLAKRRKRVPK
jgi:hypothetical protein